MPYPTARRLDLVETLHGLPVADPYRWLEDAASSETDEWSRAQDALARAVLEGLPGRDLLRSRLRELTPGSVSAPTMAGGRAFFLRRRPDQEHPVYTVRDPDGSERDLIDPAVLDPGLTTTLDLARPSPDGRLVAYVVSEGGREEGVLWVADTATGQVVDGPVVLGRGPDVAWLAGEEMVYVGRLPDGQRPPGEEQFHRRVWRRRLGSPPGSESLLFGEGEDETAYFGLAASPDGRWLTVTVALGTAPRNDLYVCDLSGPGRFVPAHRAVDGQAFGWVAHDDRLYVVTDRDAPRWRACVADPARPGAEHWRELVPEGDDVLTGLAVTLDEVLVCRTRHVVSRVVVHDRLSGAATAELALPGLGSAEVTAAPSGGPEAWITYTDHFTPARVLRYRQGATGLTPWADPPGVVALDGVRAEQHFVASRDGTRVPVFVLHRPVPGPARPRPTVLYGYGGFDISLTPSYSPWVASWVERGGVYAVANLRGGGEYGEGWHRAGMRQDKQNVFDDAAAVAGWLVAEGWTDPPRLGVSGGSNGGLLVGALVTQRPELFRAAVCSAPLLDMVRYELFGLGRTWNDEYGRAGHPEELGWLLSYSPYHQVEEGTRYPAVLFTVFEGDTRVDPLHARKLAAALQHSTSAAPEERPVLVRREFEVGHAGRAVTRTIGLQVDTLAFLAHQLGLDLA